MQQRFCILLALLVVKTIAFDNICNSFTNEDITDPFEGVKNIFHFGIGDNPTNPLETQYYVEADWGLPSNYYTDNDWNSHLRFTSDWTVASLSLYPFFVNTAPLSGGHNRTDYNSDFVRTANLECGSNNQSFMWGPAYSDLRLKMSSQLVPIRSIDRNLEVYVHASAPNTSSYFRYIAFITNKSSRQQKLQLRTSNEANYVFQDLSPLNDGRYVAGFPWAESDPGQNSTVKEEWLNSGQWLTSIHARGVSARERRYALYVNTNYFMADFAYNGEIQAGETKAVMIVYSFAMNTTAMLQRAAWVDGEPSELFHDLTADQLSQIVNWGACQSVLGPDVTVTVTPPSQCSSDTTSDFAVKVTTNRTDLSTNFKHRVVLTQGTNEFEVVAAQSSTTLSVLNNIGQVKHQLWFKNCIVKETTFTACSNKPSSKRAVVANVVEEQVSSKKSSSSLMNVSTSLIAMAALLLRTSTTMRLCSFILVLLVASGTCQNVCNSFTKDMQTNEIGINEYNDFAVFNFGINDSPTRDQTMYAINFYFVQAYYYEAIFDEWNSQLAFTIRNKDFTSLVQTFGPVYVNNAGLHGGRNFSTYSTDFTRTADFVCSNANQTFTWGPAYPDIRQKDLQNRAQHPYLETHVQVSAPSATNYLRYIAFITNKSNKQERLHFRTSNDAYDTPLDISPSNSGRYVACFPFRDDDDGTPNQDFRTNYNRVLTSVHARGLNARETAVQSYSQGYDKELGAEFSGTIEAGETKAFMIVYSFAPNKTRMLQSAAWVDSEPAELFHGLNADQLSQIVNWGACQTILAPDVTVTVTPPSQCSSGLTSDFTVNVTTTRKDFTSSFSHRVVGGVIPVELVPVQSSNTLTVINDAGSVVHQLWYNGCLIKETPFTACETVVVPQSVPVGSTTPTTGKTSAASTLIASSAIIGAIAAFF